MTQNEDNDVARIMREIKAGIAPRIAVAVVPDEGGRWALGVAVENEEGYHPYPDAWFATQEQAKEAAAALNKRLGLDERDASLLILTTMFHKERRRAAKRKGAK